ncbi:MAG: acyltransferase family protein [Phycisphaerales bacterium]|nr:acyltransferase family protein [Phycisphaerales bacterium]
MNQPLSSVPVVHQRLHALDALRAIAMMLGVWLHAAIPYVDGVPPFFWAASDPDKSAAIGISMTIIHSWRMEVFFLLSGFFTAMMVLRKGIKSTAVHRFKRIVIPFVLAMIILQPICAALWGYGFSTQWGFPLKDAAINMIKTSWGIEVPGGQTEFGRLWHFWFLYVLCWLIAAGLIFEFIGSKLKLNVSSKLGSVVSWSFRSWFGAIVLAIPLFGAIYMHSPLGPEPMSSLKPDWTTFGYYAIPFFAGWVLYPRRDSIDQLARHWWIPLSFGILIATPIYVISLVKLGEVSYATGEQPGAMLIAIANASRVLMTTGYGLGLIGLFTRMLSTPGPKLSKVVRYGSDSAYWVYLVHLPLVVLGSILLLKLNVPAEIKMLIAMVASGFILLITYHFGVRYTPIGTMLNGKRQKPKAVESDNAESNA